MKRHQQGEQGRSAFGAMGDLYAYIFCMLISKMLVDMPIFGGALYMSSRVATAFYGTFMREHSAYLPARVQGWRRAMLVLLLLVNLCVLVIYPNQLDSPSLWILFALVLVMLLRDAFTLRLVRLSVHQGMEERRFVLLLCCVQLLHLMVMAAIFLYNLPMEEGLFLLGCYGLCSGMAVYGQMKERTHMRAMEAALPDQVQKTRETLSRANAYTSYEKLSALILIALEMTLVLLYTYMAASAKQMLGYMILAVGFTLVSREAAEYMLRRREKRGKTNDPTNLMLVALLLWLYGLIVFNRSIGAQVLQHEYVFISLGLCTAGATICTTCMGRMEQTMAAVDRFTSDGGTTGFRQMRTAIVEFAILLGQMLALVMLTALCFATGKDLPRDVSQLAARFQPLMVLPAMLTVLSALLSVLKFPLSTRHMQKLSRFLRLKEAGGDNPALRRQLEGVVVQRRSQPFFIRALMALLRPFFRHELKGVENIQQDDDNPIVFLCNHGELYGPIACMLNIPVPIRPWSISEMVVDKDEVAAYVHKYTISRQKWLPERLKWPIANLIGPLSVWAMRQLESIPVYRNKLRELMKTFTLSVEAMEAGDNLLIFPENPDGVEQGKGYERAGVGEMFRGFAMLAPIYYNKTGKRCRFLPMFAHKNARTMSFGTPIAYDPDTPPNEERDRIVDAVILQMQEMAQREEALYQRKQA
ncbi:MAG: 1-acyl-sn-glycerol-3-phosphate acyltransferase [Clostridia bacterium]|nr:1-acyl-sn-glycerol-3-phosphate acyltransferase [Clostridia bacterium]